MAIGARVKRRVLEERQRVIEWDAVVEKTEQVARDAKRVAKRAVNGHRLKAKPYGQEPGESS